MTNQGYMIVRITNPANTRPFIAWMDDDRTIARDMASWLRHGETMEILEYVPNIDPRTDVNLIPQLNLWRDHLKGQDDGL